MANEDDKTLEQIQDELGLNKSWASTLVDYMWIGLAKAAGYVFTNLWNAFMKVMGNVEDTAWNAMFDAYVNNGLIQQDQADRMKDLKDLSSPLDLLVYVYLQINLIGETVSINSEFGGNFLRQALAEQMRSSVPDAFSVLKAAFIAPEKTGEVRDVLRKQGLTEEHIDLIFLSNYRLYDESTIRDLFLRGVLTPEQAYERMRELGYTDTRIKEIANLWEIIPPVQDLITMVAREAFEEDIVQEIGLDAEFPDDQTEWLEKLGLSPQWQHRYWRSHWQQPSVEMGFEMLHREDPDNPGNSIIDLKGLDTLFRIQEIPPYWRDKLTKIAYQPYTRVDVRRMHDLGILNDEQLLQSYKDLGYDDEKAYNMALFTVRYNAETSKDLSQSQVVNAFKKGLIEKKDAITLVEQVGYSNAQADFIVSMAEYEQEIEYQEQIIDNIRDQYQDNRIDKLTARGYLGELNLPTKAIEIYMDTWEIKRLKNSKKPSKTDLDKFYKAKIITSDQYRNEMEKLGYSFEYIEWYEKAAKK